MKKSMVVTNLRIEKDDWLQMKSMAAELGMSVNQYINYFIKDLSIRRELATMSTIQKKQKKPSIIPIWNLGMITRKTKSKALGQLSPNDKVVYE